MTALGSVERHPAGSAAPLCSPCRRRRHEACTGHGCACECRDDELAEVTELHWETPPPRANGGVRRNPRTIPETTIAALRARPGQWARIMVFVAKTSASSCHSAMTKAGLPPGIELRSGRLPDGSAIWARYVS